MKKILAIACFTLFLMSCKKDHTCECSTGGTVISTTTITDTKANAKKSCDSNDASLLGIVISCELK